MKDAVEPKPDAPQLKLLSIIIPARDEAGCIASTISHLNLELKLHQVPHEIAVVDDGSKDETWRILQEYSREIPELRPFRTSARTASVARLSRAWIPCPVTRR